MGDSSVESAGKAAVPPPAEVDAEKKSTTAGDQVDSNGPVNEDKEAKEVKARPEREATAADYFRVFTYAKKWDFVLMAAAALASIGAGTTLPLMNVVFGRLVGDFNSYFSPNAQEADEFSRQINRMSLYMFALFIARFGLNYINKFCFRLIGIRMSAAIRLHYLRSLFGQTIHVLDSMPSGTAASTITGTANTLQLGISEKLGTFLEFTSTIVTAIIVAFTYSWSLTLVTASVILFISLVLSILLPFIIKGQTRLTRADAKGTSVATEAFSTIRMITACGAQDRMSQRYAEWVAKAKDAVQFSAPFMSVQFGAVFFGLYGAFALAFWFGMKSYIEGRLEGIATILIVLMSVMLMVISLERISTPLIAVSKAMVAAAEFFAVIDAPKPNMGTLKEPDVSAEQDIVFEDVHFAYPSRPSKKVLDGLNLRIGANLNTAIGRTNREEVKRQLVKEACVPVGDSGAKLSGGQRQRIAIARSIIKKPKILILDEATSAIDVRGERIVQAALERASKGRTTVTIAHRLSTIKNADRICVLQNGVVAEEGTHDSLLENELGVYYGLVNAQKLSLGDETGEELLHDEDIGAILAREKSAAKSVAESAKQEAKWKDRNVFNGFGKLILEQRSRDPQALKELLGINLMMLLVGIFSLIGALAISFAYGWKLALVALCVTVPLGVLAGFFRVRYELQFNAMNEQVFQESSKFGAEAIGAFRTVSALVMEDNICDRYQNLLSGHVWAAYRKARFTTIVFAFADSASLGCQALIFWYGGQLLLSREDDASQSKDQITDTDGGVKIELKDVHFKYPTRDVSIFKGLNITIEKGQFAALVGASGSGKTSIVSLLERFYDVSKGQILFNGKDITDVNVYEYRKLLSLVAQESSLFHGTIRENLLLGVDPSTITDEQLHQCCRDASIHEFIMSLPDGYNTNIGSRGVSLSGGQKQRVSIARALIRNPRVLLLDEATSSLDSESEKLVQAAFERVAKGRTTVAVAHRLATIQKADIIYVLGEGKVLEKGTHAELLKQKGVYWHMCHNQALDR
ncbi:hypothetical protein CHGG_01623 [Chaetomium globosum CBS 148.51]|uniref:Uncharacterized protein n=1 Tax=Chaetomium globosum (strain ATCC 6205 / CBS 148.51 / DSM 1962 / NBRC 6347 / NRRL 1970) TaxID=306901 RepID=Q2HDT1_CHAGB|nr:uncharacterized protein CHGG_01623 [Chaetomium globosum CBS 148.51]EAQ93388.1 hypothetical protein CHGG_01623 [Chaetomium globosum CBS 148.51]